MVLGIQNDEAALDRTIDDQPDLLDIAGAYREGGFWVPGFRPSTAEDLPLGYDYPDRNSRVFRLQLASPDAI